MVQTPEKLGSMENSAKSALDETKERMRDLSDKIEKKSHQAKEKMEEVGDSMCEYIRGRPYQSVLIAAAVGAVLGMLFKK